MLSLHHDEEHDFNDNRVRATVGGTTTLYIGAHFEWTGSTNSMVKYYYAGATRVAMRTGTSTLRYLFSDHPSTALGTSLGSTSITTDASGNRIAELRTKAWGETRTTYGTTPTQRRYTGQIDDGFGLISLLPSPVIYSTIVLSMAMSR
jgi:hypothetical protein